MEALNQKKLPIQLQKENHYEIQSFYKNRIDYLQKKDTEYSNSILAIKNVIILLIITLVGYSLFYPHHYGNLIDDLIIPATIRLTSTLPLFALIWRFEKKCKSCDTQINEYLVEITKLSAEHAKTIRNDYPKSGDFIKMEKPNRQAKLTTLINNKDPTDKTNLTDKTKKNWLLNLSNHMR